MSKESGHLCRVGVLPSVEQTILEAMKLLKLSLFKVTAPLGWKVIYFSSYKMELDSGHTNMVLLGLPHKSNPDYPFKE